MAEFGRAGRAVFCASGSHCILVGRFLISKVWEWQVLVVKVWTNQIRSRYFGRTNSPSVVKVATDQRGRKSLEMSSFGHENLDGPNLGLDCLDMPKFIHKFLDMSKICHKSLDISLGPRPGKRTGVLFSLNKCVQLSCLLSLYFIRLGRSIFLADFGHLWRAKKKGKTTICHH